jgi:hypothetical protein
MEDGPAAFAYVQSKAAIWLKMPAGAYRAQDPLQLADADWPEERLRPLMEQLADGKGASLEAPLQARDIADVYQVLLTLHLEPRGVRSTFRAGGIVDRYDCEHAVMGTRLAVFAEVTGGADQ